MIGNAVRASERHGERKNGHFFAKTTMKQDGSAHERIPFLSFLSLESPLSLRLNVPAIRADWRAESQSQREQNEPKK